MDDEYGAEAHAAETDDHQMEEHDELEGDEPESAAPAGKTVDVQQLADVIGTMSRFVSKLTEAAPVKSEGLGLVEWLSLRQIAATEGLRQNQLSNTLGVTRQRGNHITKSLSNSGLITIATVEGSKATTLAATDLGREKATAIDEAVMGLLGPKLDGKSGSLGQLRKRLTQMSKSIPVTKSGGKKKAKGAEGEAGATMPKGMGKTRGKGKGTGKAKGAGKGMGAGKGTGAGKGKGKKAAAAA